MDLATPVQYVKGVGPRMAKLLERLEVRTVADLLWHLPFRYIDRRRIDPIARVFPGKDRVVVGEIVASGVAFLGRRRTRIYEVIIADKTGTVSAKWFHFYPAAFERRFKKGRQILLAGELTQYGHVKQFVHPETELFEEGDDSEISGKILPIYPSTEGITQRWLRRVISNAWEGAQPAISDSLTEELRLQYRLIPIPQALEELHFPPPDANVGLLNDRRSQSHRSLIFDECFYLELGLALHRARGRVEEGIPMPFRSDVMAAFEKALPFPLTGAQRRICAEIAEDMATVHPMHRLVQGDVGSGKTVVAIAAALQTIAAGYQVALMAPTEILAEQHARTITPWMETLAIKWALLTGSTKGAERRDICTRAESGDLPLLIGTHALIASHGQAREKLSSEHSEREGRTRQALPVGGATQAPVINEGVRFAKLGLAIVDEQHRFGVEQRLALKQKATITPSPLRGEGRGEGETIGTLPLLFPSPQGRGGSAPHMLVMTATPIPRTLAMTIYGDLDISTLDEMPPGRRPVITKLYTNADRPRLYEGMRKELLRGRQIYVVYPLVEESEKMDLKNATDMSKELAVAFAPAWNVALLHGKMKGTDKEGIMLNFKDAKTNILATTSVVEVGVDVPNATVMIIEHAERFGLSQLHQLRGRVGRGNHQSYCILVAHGNRTETAQARLKIMTETNDGFRIAEEDLNIRGPGEFLGTRQSGIPELRVARLVEDAGIIEMARDAAFRVIREDTNLAGPHASFGKTVSERWGYKLALGAVG